MKTLTKSQVLRLHEAMISETGGSSGIRDEGLLDSALNTPFVASKTHCIKLLRAFCF